MTDSRRKWEYTLQTIAEVTGLSINTVRDHKEKEELDPGNMVSVIFYVLRMWIKYGKVSMHELFDQLRRPGPADKNDVDEFGNPVH